MSCENPVIILIQNYHLKIEYISSKTKQSQSIAKIYKNLVEDFTISPYHSLFKLAFTPDELKLSANLEFWKGFARLFTETLRLSESLEVLREKQIVSVEKSILKDLCDRAPYFQGFEYLNDECLDFHWKALNEYFSNQIKTYEGSVESFFLKYSPDVHLVGKIYFHLVEQKTESSAFAFMATYSAGLNRKNQAQHRPLQYALTEFENDQDKLLELLSTVSNAAKESNFLKDLLDSGELFYPLNFSPDESFQFLKEIPLYEKAGILCRIPNWWRRGKKSASLSISFGEKKQASLMGLESLIDFQARIMIGDVELSAGEAEEILKQSEGLANIKGKWVVVDKDKLSQSLDNWEKAASLLSNENIALSDALRMLMSRQNNSLSDILTNDNVEIGIGDWLKGIMGKMRNPELLKETKITRDFKAELRPYQQTGLNWLTLLDSLRLGACLADDMGLGKTIQVLALLNGLRKKKKYTTSLLVLPVSLIHNWASEFEKFAPAIKFIIAHPGGGKDILGKNTTAEEISEWDIIITSYGYVKRYQWIQDFKWNYIILDEAQAIKNAATAQTRTIKSLKSNNRIVLTGTPIENRLSDLWSLFDFLNPGMLGNKSEFSKFIKNSDDLGALRQVISPYILRRLKTDKNVISDLPDKIEVDSYSGLSKTQRLLYKQQVDILKNALEDSDGGMKRKGLVLSSLIKFKQICNHPDQYLGNTAYKPADSGKFERLREICETIYQKREKVLIFTQFKEIIEHLEIFLEDIFERKGLILHGSTAVSKRKDLVKQFQSDEYIPFFILSIKAGGTGLNLTAANHVIHFDRWWNPAVENQATDRAFRIGQKKSVMVHKFISEGTIEEKIAMMLEEKKALSDEVLKGSSESAFITEMDDEELINMFSLKAGI
ncbi:MAG: ATP-dependent helicase [Spirochaetaceae bacterium 4572_59]|nr:MAG: ATP-dependent helicase [Spirochaetaceae bacterium 4572_59]